LPAVIAQEANRFAEQFLPTTPAPTAIETTASVTTTQQNTQPLRWHNVTSPAQAYALAATTVHKLLKEQGVKPADIVILTPNQRDGWALIRQFAKQNLAVNHVLAEDDGSVGRKRERYRKRTFADGDLRLKVSTIHSFKGWELNHVILLTPEDDKFWEAQSPYLFYVAMTRTRQSLVVLNRHPAYRAYGEGWDVYATAEKVDVPDVRQETILGS
jgi:ATP-dependent exoDNAse (exonuclease V) beta subunit